MWAGVLFFLFCVGAVFYVFEHINIWIQKNHVEKPKPTCANNNNDIVSSIKIEMAETPFLSSKYIFKRVSIAQQFSNKTKSIYKNLSFSVV